MIDFMFAAGARAAFEAEAARLGWGQMVDGEFVPNAGVDIDVIGDLVSLPGKYDAAGNEIEAPVTKGPHVNVRLSGSAAAATRRRIDRRLGTHYGDVDAAMTAWFTQAGTTEVTDRVAARVRTRFATAKDATRRQKDGVTYIGSALAVAARKRLWAGEDA